MTVVRVAAVQSLTHVLLAGVVLLGALLDALTRDRLTVHLTTYKVRVALGLINSGWRRPIKEFRLVTLLVQYMLRRHGCVAAWRLLILSHGTIRAVYPGSKPRVDDLLL